MPQAKPLSGTVRSNNNVKPMPMCRLLSEEVLIGLLPWSTEKSKVPKYLLNR